MLAYLQIHFLVFRRFEPLFIFQFIKWFINFNTVIYFIYMNERITESSWLVWIYLGNYNFGNLCCRFCSFNSNSITAETIFIRRRNIDDRNIDRKNSFIKK